MLLLWLYGAFLLCVIVIDYEQRRVLNVILLPAYPLAFLFSFGVAQPDPMQALLGAWWALPSFCCSPSSVVAQWARAMSS